MERPHIFRRRPADSRDKSTYKVYTVGKVRKRHIGECNCDERMANPGTYCEHELQVLKPSFSGVD